MTSENAKYYLGLTFTADMGDGLHCTHCYFGTLSSAKFTEVVTAVDGYWNAFGPIGLRKVAFTVPALFGPERDIRVLLTSDVHAFDPLRQLRNHFGAAGLISTEYPFRPHVTSPANSINKPFDSYALVRGGIIIRSWPIFEIVPL